MTGRSSATAMAAGPSRRVVGPIHDAGSPADRLLGSFMVVSHSGVLHRTS